MLRKFYSYELLENPFPTTLDDSGQADKLIEFAGSNIRFVDGLGWMKFNGKYWEHSQFCADVAAMALTEVQLQEAQRLESSSLMAIKQRGLKLTGAKAKESMTAEELKIIEDANDAKSIMAFVKKQRSAAGISNVVKVFKSKIGLTPSEDFDKSAYEICTPNGVYDLRRGMDGYRPAKASDYMSLCTAVAPGDEGEEMWNEALKTATNGNQELIEFIQLVAGLGLIGEVKLQTVILIWGPSGSSKSTIWNPMTACLGSYAINLNADLLLSNKVSDNTAMSERASLRKKRWGLFSEVDEGVLDESSLKKLVSTDTIKGRYLYQTSIQFEPSHSIYGYLNVLPVFNAYSDAVRNRIMVIPFTSVIDSNKKIPNYGKVLLDKAGPAILAFMIEGAKKIIDLDFKIQDKIPSVVTDFMNGYMAKQDWLTEFLDSVCIYGDDQCLNAGQIYDVYIAYCRSKNKRPVSTEVFADLMKSRFDYESKRLTVEGRRARKSVYKGLALNLMDPQVSRYFK